jgi:hypothetical protein
MNHIMQKLRADVAPLNCGGDDGVKWLEANGW